MAFYTNHSTHNAIVTVQIQSTLDAQKTLQKGTKTAYTDIAADVGYHDIVVEPGVELKLAEQTSATLIGIRADV